MFLWNSPLPRYNLTNLANSKPLVKFTQMKMLHLPDYQETKQIYTGTNTLVYRAIRGIDDQPVIIKVLRNPRPNLNELVKFRNQYLLTRELEHPLLVQPLALEDYGNGYALVMQDEGEIPLGEYW